MNTVPTAASLNEVNDQLSQACALLSEWHARQTDTVSGRTYVAAGHEAIAAIDAIDRALYTCRSALVGELRRDDDERAVRVDLLLAECRARRESERRQGDREDPETGVPIPAGIEGYAPYPRKG